MSRNRNIRRAFKPAVFVLSLSPALLLGYRFATGNLGADPVETLEHTTGDWALYFLMITLSVSPLMKITGWGVLLSFRRMMGLFAFFYACCHFLIYLFIDRFLYWPEIWDDIFKRPYITVGFAALVILIPLAVTSTKGWIKRLGAARWNRLHQLVYVAAGLGILHYLWGVKIDTIRKPTVLGILLVLILAMRFVPLAKIRSSLRKRHA